MGVADHLRKKVGNVTATSSGAAASTDVADSDDRPRSRTAVGENMIYGGKLQEALERVRSLEKALASNATKDLSLSRIREVPGRRRMLTSVEYAELKANLSRKPLLQPVLVRLLADGDFELIAGHNRVAIYRELGRETIKGYVVEVADNEVELAAFTSNLLAPALSDFEKLLNFKRIQEQTGLSRAEIAEATGISESHIQKIFCFDRLPSEAQEILARRPERLGSTSAQKLAALAQAGKMAKVVEAVQRLVDDDDLTQEQAVALATDRSANTNAAASLPEPLVLKSGRKKVCEVTVRKGVVAAKFSDLSAEDEARWRQEIYDFIAEKLSRKVDQG